MIVTGAKVAREAIDPVASKLLALDISRVVERVHDLIGGRQGSVRELLGRFQANVASVTYQIVAQHTPHLQDAGITVTRRFPEEACLVFAEDANLRLAVHNVVKNVWKHSNGRRLAIIGEVEPSQAHMTIVFADDGKGMAGQPGTGLTMAARLVEAYGGTFSTGGPEARTDLADDGFKTVVTIRLPFLPARKEVPAMSQGTIVLIDTDTSFENRFRRRLEEQNIADQYALVH